MAQDSPHIPAGWSRISRDGVEMLSRTFSFDNFSSAMAFAGRVGEVADAADHHPELIVAWGRVTVLWWSHDHGGITDRDISLAETTDRLYS